MLDSIRVNPVAGIIPGCLVECQEDVSDFRALYIYGAFAFIYAGDFGVGIRSRIGVSPARTGYCHRTACGQADWNAVDCRPLDHHIRDYRSEGASDRVCRSYRSRFQGFICRGNA